MYAVGGDLVWFHRCLKKVVKALSKQSGDYLPNWRDADDAARWFMHHTVILVRQYRTPIALQDDILLAGVGGPDVVQYQAVIQALRKLPEQQQEAFLMNVAQKWNTRYTAVAMDCSNTAALGHLEASVKVLKELSGTHFPALCQAIHQVHRSLPVDLPVRPANIASLAIARRSFSKIVRLIAWLIILCVIAVMIWIAVMVVPNIEI